MRWAAVLPTLVALLGVAATPLAEPPQGVAEQVVLSPGRDIFADLSAGPHEGTSSTVANTDGVLCELLVPISSTELLILTSSLR